MEDFEKNYTKLVCSVSMEEDFRSADCSSTIFVGNAAAERSTAGHKHSETEIAHFLVAQMGLMKPTENLVLVVACLD